MKKNQMIICKEKRNIPTLKIGLKGIRAFELILEYAGSIGGIVKKINKRKNLSFTSNKMISHPLVASIL